MDMLELLLAAILAVCTRARGGESFRIALADTTHHRVIVGQRVRLEAASLEQSTINVSVHSAQGRALGEAQLEFALSPPSLTRAAPHAVDVMLAVEGESGAVRLVVLPVASQQPITAFSTRWPRDDSACVIEAMALKATHATISDALIERTSALVKAERARDANGKSAQACVSRLESCGALRERERAVCAAAASERSAQAQVLASASEAEARQTRAALEAATLRANTCAHRVCSVEPAALAALNATSLAAQVRVGELERALATQRAESDASAARVAETHAAAVSQLNYKLAEAARAGAAARTSELAAEAKVIELVEKKSSGAATLVEKLRAAEQRIAALTTALDETRAALIAERDTAATVRTAAAERSSEVSELNALLAAVEDARASLAVREASAASTASSAAQAAASAQAASAKLTSEASQLRAQLAACAAEATTSAEQRRASSAAEQQRVEIAAARSVQLAAERDALASGINELNSLIEASSAEVGECRSSVLALESTLEAQRAATEQELVKLVGEREDALARLNAALAAR
jgi:hypothetical protein